MHSFVVESLSKFQVRSKILLYAKEKILDAKFKLTHTYQVLYPTILSVRVINDIRVTSMSSYDRPKTDFHSGCSTSVCNVKKQPKPRLKPR
jgi:hypothetical protein